MANKKKQENGTTTGPRVSRRQQRVAEQARAAWMRQLQIVAGVVMTVLLIAAFAFWRHAYLVPVAEVIALTSPNLDGAAKARCGWWNLVILAVLLAVLGTTRELKNSCKQSLMLK